MATVKELEATVKGLEALVEAQAALVDQMVETVNALEQRSSNFAARVNASNNVYRAEITALRDAVERLAPKAKAPAAPRLSDGQWNRAVAALKAATPGVTFFAPGLVRAEAERQLLSTERKVPMTVAPVEEFTL